MLVLVPIINIAAALLLIIVALVMFVVGILYLVFLSSIPVAPIGRENGAALIYERRAAVIQAWPVRG